MVEERGGLYHVNSVALCAWLAEQQYAMIEGNIKVGAGRQRGRGHKCRRH